MESVEELKNMPYELYLLSAWWNMTRKIAVSNAEGKCQICGRGHELEVHHLSYDRLGDERASDLLVVCSRCHNDIHYYSRGIMSRRINKKSQTDITQKEYYERKELLSGINR